MNHLRMLGLGMIQHWNQLVMIPYKKIELGMLLLLNLLTVLLMVHCMTEKLVLRKMLLLSLQMKMIAELVIEYLWNLLMMVHCKTGKLVLQILQKLIVLLMDQCKIGKLKL